MFGCAAVAKVAAKVPVTVAPAEVVSNFLKTENISILHPNYLLNYKDP